MRCLSKEEYREISDITGHFEKLHADVLNDEYARYLDDEFIPSKWTNKFSSVREFCLLLEEAEKLKIMEETLKAIEC